MLYTAARPAAEPASGSRAASAPSAAAGPGASSVAALEQDIARLEQAQHTAPPGSTDAASNLHQLVRAYAELELLAAEQGDPSLALRARASCIEAATTVRARFPGYAELDQVLYELGQAYLRGGDRAGAREAYFELIKKAPDSPRAPAAYLDFAEMFADEAMTDPSKLELARQAYLKVLTYPPPQNRGWGYACYKLAWIEQNHGDAKAALGYLVKVIEWGQSSDADGSRADKLVNEARKDLVTFYSSEGKPERAFDFFQRFSGDAPGEHKRTAAMVVRLARVYADQGQAAEATAAGADVLARVADEASCSGLRRVLAELRAAAGSAPGSAAPSAAAPLEAALANACAMP